MRRFSMLEVISILGLPMPRNGRSSYNISCPYCDTKPKQKHLKSEYSVYKLLISGKLKGFRIGRVWKIPKKSLDKYIDECVEK